MKKAILRILIFFVFPVHSFAQPEQITGKLGEYCSRVPWEEVYVHTDRDSYIAGEDMWLKMYSFERYTCRSSKSTIAYFELLSYGNRPVIRKRVRLEGGAGPCHVALPDTLSPGTYTIRAYTNVMKNFMPDNCFVKEINIYSAIGSAERKKLPGTVSSKPNSALQGWDLEVENQMPDSITLKVTGLLPQDRDSQLFILIHSRGNIHFAENRNLAGNRLELSLERERFERGILHISLFSKTGVPLAERFVYNPGPTESRLSVEVEGSYRTREKINLEIKGSPGDFSVSVSPLALRSSDISDYLVYGSEFGGIIQKAFTGKNLDDLPLSYVDSLLAEAESGWIRWEKVLSGKLTENRYPPEVNEHFLTGSLVGGDPSGKFVLMSIPGKDAYFQYSEIDDYGNFSFSIPADDEQRTLIIQPDSVSRGNVARLSSSFMEDYQQTVPESDSSELPAYIDGLSTNYQVGRIYGTVLSSPSTAKPATARPSKRFYGKPDIELVLDDYIKLPVMEEIFFEIIPGVSLKKRRGSYEITLTNPSTNTINVLPPSLFVDGVRIDKADIIANIDPEFVEKIDVVLERYLIGDYLFNGIVNVITKRADFSSVELPEYALRTRYRTFEPVSEFAAPLYNVQEKKQSRIPDFRNTLYWNPSVVLKSGESRTLEIWSSDVPGDYEINIQGLAPDGRVITARKIITIK
jgi:hypothetical protein